MIAPDSLARPTFAARLSTDALTAARLQDALAEIWEGESVAIAIAQEPDERWLLALHFRDPPDESLLRAHIASLAGDAVAALIVVEELAPTDWVSKSLEGLQPVHAGRFVVHGAHQRHRVGINRIGIQIEAALAFGTGHHGSTRGCLLALDRILKRDSRKNAGRRKARPRLMRVGTIGDAPSARLQARRNDFAHLTAARHRRRKAPVLDIGTGTGVLAIAAAKALQRPVLAGEIDRRAVTIARDNARINRVASRIEVLHAAGVSARRFRERSPFAVVLANILLDPLQKLATPIAKLVAPNGSVVLSGLLSAQAGAATASYRARGVVLAHRVALGGWTTLMMVRPGRTRR